MAYQFKESKQKVQLFRILILPEMWDRLRDIAEFEHTSRSKIINEIIRNGGDYDKLQKSKSFRYGFKNQKTLLKQKAIKKVKARVQKEWHITQCLPYFADKGVV